MDNERFKMATKLYYGSDDNELISLINKQDEAALLQFAMKHIDHLIYWITWHGHHSGQEPRFMRILLPDFMDTVRSFAKKYKYKALPKNWDVEFRSLNFKKYSVKLAKMIAEKQQSWIDFDLKDEQIRILNQLNDFLTIKESEIIERVRSKVPKLENRFKGEFGFSSDLKSEVEVCFFINGINGSAVYTTTYFFNKENVLRNKWALLNREEDWSGMGWLPKLENRCCYLMHELVYHSNMMGEIFKIDCITIDIKVIKEQISYFNGNSWVNK